MPWFIPWMMMQGQQTRSPFQEFEEAFKFVKEWEDKNKKKDDKPKGPRLADVISMFGLLLFISPFVGMVGSYLIVVASSHYVEAMSKLLK